MKYGNYYMRNEIERTKIYDSLKVKCKHCGHLVIIKNGDKELCQHCGWYVFKDKKAEFKFRLNNELKKRGIE